MSSRGTNGVGVQVEDTKICVVMVGLPARGKSYIAQKGKAGSEKKRTNPAATSFRLDSQCLFFLSFFFFLLSWPFPSFRIFSLPDVLLSLHLSISACLPSFFLASTWDYDRTLTIIVRNSPALPPMALHPRQDVQRRQLSAQ
jgi:hypothetical protein